MSKPGNGLELQVTIDESDSDEQRIDELALSLRRELLSADVARVARKPAGPPAPGSRGLDAVTVGTLLVAVTGSAFSVTQVVNVIRGWVGRSSTDCGVEISVGRSVLKLAGPPTEDQRRLIDQFLGAVASPPPAED